MSRTIPPSELIINSDGSVFHLHVKPGEVAPIIILVGDPGRVERVAAHFDQITHRAANREFVTITGSFHGKPMSVVSTGIGTDNIDIVVNELDALFNIDFDHRTVRRTHQRLTLLRLGTCGAIQPDLKIGDRILSQVSIGFDGLLNYYAGRNRVCDPAMEQAFVEHVGWSRQQTAPYFVRCSARLARALADCTSPGVTISAPGFYAPQGRYLRLRPADPGLNRKIESFRYQGMRITNFEMESSAVAGLALLLGHDAATVCTVIAQRVALDSDTDYQPFVDKMIKTSLEKLAAL